MELTPCGSAFHCVRNSPPASRKRCRDDVDSQSQPAPTGNTSKTVLPILKVRRTDPLGSATVIVDKGVSPEPRASSASPEGSGALVSTHAAAAERATVAIEQHCAIASLSNDALSVIFGFLSFKDVARCAQVCTQWQEVAYSEPLWHSVDLHPLSTTVLSPGLCLLANRLAPVRSLNLKECTLITDAGLSSVAETVTGELRELDLSGCHELTDASIIPLIRRSPKLIKIDLSRTKVTRRTLLALAKYCPQLKELSLLFCHRAATPKGIASLAALKQLERLETWCSYHLSDSGLIALVNSCRKLRYMCFSSCHVTDMGLQAIAQSLTQLVAFRVADCNLITDSGMMGLLSLCKELKHVDMRDCEGISDQSIALLNQRYPRLLRPREAGLHYIEQDGAAVPAA